MKEITIITYVLSKPFADGTWYDVEEYESLNEAKKRYAKEMVAEIIQKKVETSIVFRKGTNKFRKEKTK